MKRKKKIKFTSEYVAGIIDGEGCISIHGNKAAASHPSKRPRILLQVSITNTCKPLLEQIKAQYGGGAINSHRAQKYNKNAKDSWTWIIVENMAVEFLREIYPYLFVKKKQAELAFEFSKLKEEYKRNKKGRGLGNPLTDAEYLARVAVMEKCKKLNKRGPADAA